WRFLRHGLSAAMPAVPGGRWVDSSRRTIRRAVHRSATGAGASDAGPDRGVMPMPTTFSLQTVVLICFAAIASIIAAVMLVMRDLAIGTPATRVPEKSLRDLLVRRPPAAVPDEALAS